MRVLLVDPPMQSIMRARADWFPMSLAYLAGAAKREGYEVLIYNGEHDPELDYLNLTTYSDNYHYYLEALENPADPAWIKVRKIMDDFDPDVVGLTSFSVKWPSAKRIAQIAKDFKPGIPVIMGGQHATIMKDQVLADSNIDFVARGEGEVTFVEFLKEVSGRGRWQTVPGLSFKDGGRIVHNMERPLIEDLDSLAMPARECLYDVESYGSTSLGKIFASRGCPYKCTYCGTQNIWTNRVRHHSPQRMIDEIRHVRDTYGMTYFTFFDDVFGLSKKRAVELCSEMAKAELGIDWDCLTRANLLSDELLESMRTSGCKKIDMGVESGSAKVLVDTKKGVGKEDIRRGAKLVKKHGIMLYMFFMVGLPTETEADARETREFLEELQPDWAGISIFTPIPGTEIYKDLQGQGRIPASPDFGRFSHQSPHSNFAFSMLNRDSFPRLAQDTIQFVQDYNGSYRNLLRRAMTRGYHRNPGLFFSDLKKLMTWKGLMQKSHQGSHAKFYDKAGNA